MTYTTLTYSFPSFELFRCSMSGSNSCFLSRIQVSQEAGKVVCYFHLFKNFPQFAVIHTVKGFLIVNEADVFLELPCFVFDPTDVGNLTSVPLPFLHPACTSGSSQFTHCWSLAWRILSIILLACEISAIVWYTEHSLALPFFGIGKKTDQLSWTYSISPSHTFKKILQFKSLLFLSLFLKMSFTVFPLAISVFAHQPLPLRTLWPLHSKRKKTCPFRLVILSDDHIHVFISLLV